jgi:hypothetical protein
MHEIDLLKKEAIMKQALRDVGCLSEVTGGLGKFFPVWTACNPHLNIITQ